MDANGRVPAVGICLVRLRSERLRLVKYLYGKGMTKEEQATLQKFSTEGLINVETQRFRLDPNMCYVPKDVRAQDPAFWMPKKPVMKAPSTQQP